MFGTTKTTRGFNFEVTVRNEDEAIFWNFYCGNH